MRYVFISGAAVIVLAGCGGGTASSHARPSVSVDTSIPMPPTSGPPPPPAKDIAACNAISQAINGTPVGTPVMTDSLVTFLRAAIQRPSVVQTEHAFRYLHNMAGFLYREGTRSEPWNGPDRFVALPIDLLIASERLKILRYGYNDPNGLLYAHDALKSVNKVRQDCLDVYM
jgi:hypothetical protein